MSHIDHDAPEAEGAARAAQLAAMSITILEAIARLRAQRLAERTADDERAASAARAQRLADHAGARLTWTPAHDDDWLRRASTRDLAQAWAAAAPWSATDLDAHDAQHRVETRLHQLHPEAMSAYHEARAAGLEPAEAMRQAAPLFARPLALEPGGDATTDHTAAAVHPPRSPRDVAADGYPYPTADAVARAAQKQPAASQVITAVPKRARPSTQR